MRIDPEHPVVQRCAAGMEAEGKGEPEEAKRLFEEAWGMAATAYEQAIAAHYVARHQPTKEQEYEWNIRALKIAKSSDEEEMKMFLPSLYLNAGMSTEKIGKPGRARELYQKGRDASELLRDDPYSRMIISGIDAGLDRTRSEAGLKIE